MKSESLASTERIGPCDSCSALGINGPDTVLGVERDLMERTPVESCKASAILRNRMPELDSLRGVAILMVLVYHGFFWSTGLTGLSGFAKLFVRATSCGWLGVNLFFVLSGFLITGILLESRSEPHYFRRFYTRRALRILPALYALLTLLILTGFPGRPYLLVSFLYLSNVAPLAGITVTYPMLWSLAVEEHFYLLWPAVVRKLSSGALATTILAILIAEPAVRTASFWFGLRDGLSSYTWLVADGLAVGSGLALFVRSTWFSRRGLTQLSLGLLAAATLMATLGAPYGILTRQQLLGSGLQLTIFNFLFGGLLGGALLLGSSQWGFLVNRTGLQFLGNISYGLYLVHWLAFYGYDAMVKAHWPALYPSAGRFGVIVLRFGVASAVAILVAALSRHYFEEPFLRLKDRLA